jgi:hypothetical protein
MPSITIVNNVEKTHIRVTDLNGRTRTYPNDSISCETRSGSDYVTILSNKNVVIQALYTTFATPIGTQVSADAARQYIEDNLLSKCLTILMFFSTRH